MGALTGDELRRALADRGEVVVWSEESELRAVAAAGGGARPREARLRDGPARHARPRAGERASSRPPSEAPGVRLAGLMTHFATADELDDGGFFAEQLERFARWARPLAESAARSCSLHAANSAAVLRDAGRALRHGPLRHRGLRHGPVRRGSGRARARAGARARLLRRRGQAAAGRGRARATAGASSPSATPRSGCCRSATATAGGAGSRTTPRC